MLLLTVCFPLAWGSLWEEVGEVRLAIVGRDGGLLIATLGALLLPGSCFIRVHVEPNGGGPASRAGSTRLRWPSWVLGETPRGGWIAGS